MLDAGGEAMLGVPGQSKLLPLHVAAHNSPFPAVVVLVLARGPAEALRAKIGGWGHTPLVLAEHNTGPSAAEIAALLRANATPQTNNTAMYDHGRHMPGRKVLLYANVSKRILRMLRYRPRLCMQ